MVPTRCAAGAAFPSQRLAKSDRRDGCPTSCQLNRRPSSASRAASHPPAQRPTEAFRNGLGLGTLVLKCASAASGRESNPSMLRRRMFPLNVIAALMVALISAAAVLAQTAPPPPPAGGIAPPPPPPGLSVDLAEASKMIREGQY